ncbi:MAG TPA: ABC transporter permease [candidate division Zixibacteria bacterium]|nr:ABC transporter permease [candidate division Zixibacteria bacterium]
MNTAEAIRIALQSLWANKLRSVLTLLGVVIGIAAVIAVVTFVNGINGFVAEKIFNLGADVFIVSKQPNVISNVDDFLEGKKRKRITYEDYRAVAEQCTACKYVGGSVGADKTGRVKYGEQNSNDTVIRGWTPQMAQIYDLDLLQGRMLNEADVNNANPVAIVGYDIVDNLMKGIDPIGKEIRVDGHVYTVIAVAAPKGKALGQSMDNWVLLPLTTWFKQYGENNVSLRIWGKADGVGNAMDAAIDQVRVILRSRRHDRPGEADSFVTETNQSFLSIWSNLSGTFFVVMIAIASISLIVGGIVIMNIMLVSVTERTREIGIRKALGARRSDVLRQFLIESTTLAVVGGIIGVAAGVGIAKGVTMAIGMPSEIKAWAIASGLTVAASVGIFFGVYPARKAAQLDPIVALRFEL